jgi:hypothetical protein
MNTNCESRRSSSCLEKFGGRCFGFRWHSIGLIVALAAGLSPALAVAEEDLNSHYRNSLLNDQTHFSLGTRTGLATGRLGQTPAGRRPTDRSLMPSLGPTAREPVDGQGRDR